MTSILIDFEESHLFFPRMIIGLLAVMALLMAIRFLPAKIRVLRSGDSPRVFESDARKGMVAGTMALLFAYFFLMDRVGALFPNRGFGFLFASMGFMLAASFLFMGERTRIKVIAGLVNSLLTPILAWLIFGQIFNITLP